MTEQGKLGILVGGGPAPGINAVIGAATIRAALEGVEVLAIEDGFERIMEGDISRVRPLTIENTSRIHFRGGSYIGISRANPTASPEVLETTVRSLVRLGVGHLITIGGDGTLYSASRLEQQAAGRLRVVHVPKTIDNDIDLPAHVDTFGYQTARHVGVDVVKTLMIDAKTTSRWYFVITMGRKAGHLALGIGKAAGATLTLIPEEFPAQFPLATIVDTLAGAIIKRLADGRRDGVAVIAEGVALGIDPRELVGVSIRDRDADGHSNLSDVNFGEILKRAVERRIAGVPDRPKISDKEIGYELRCAEPIPLDMEYARDLGYCATKFLVDGGNAAMVSMQAGRFVAIPFTKLIDPIAGRVRVRMVDIDSERYVIARRYMIRVRRRDFANPQELARIAAAAGLSVEEFRAQFEYLTAADPPALDLRATVAPDRGSLVGPPGTDRRS
jgi:6-phosphofructokinase 1